ncbi:MAG: IS256 family transposase [Rhodothermales bacterium]
MDKNVIEFTQSKLLVDDPLTEIIRSGARELLAAAFEAEVESFLCHYDSLRDPGGRRRLVRNGYHTEREVETGIGAVSVRVPRVRDRADEEQIRFRSSILPPYLRKTRSIEALIPWLYLKGISTGQMGEALAALLGQDAPGLSAPTVGRLKQLWLEEYGQWKTRRLDDRRYVYFWADGVFAPVRMDQEKQCFLVLMAATRDGKKELVAIEDGYRESSESWTSLLLDLKRRGLLIGAKLAVGDGALGFWKALHRIYPETRMQRCWVHKTKNVLNRLPKRLQSRAKSALHQIWMAETREQAKAAFDSFVSEYGPKYPKAVASLEKDRDELLAFYDFPAEHWQHLRTTNPIESTFATIKLRTAKTRGCLSRDTALMMAFRLTQEAEKKWRRLNGSHHLAKIVAGITYIDGIETDRIAA